MRIDKTIKLKTHVNNPDNIKKVRKVLLKIASVDNIKVNYQHYVYKVVPTEIGSPYVTVEIEYIPGGKAVVRHYLYRPELYRGEVPKHIRKEEFFAQSYDYLNLPF